MCVCAWLVLDLSLSLSFSLHSIQPTLTVFNPVDACALKPFDPRCRRVQPQQAADGVQQPLIPARPACHLLSPFVCPSVLWAAVRTFLATSKPKRDRCWRCMTIFSPRRHDSRLTSHVTRRSAPWRRGSAGTLWRATLFTFQVLICAHTPPHAPLKPKPSQSRTTLLTKRNSSGRLAACGHELCNGKVLPRIDERTAEVERTIKDHALTHASSSLSRQRTRSPSCPCDVPAPSSRCDPPARPAPH